MLITLAARQGDPSKITSFGVFGAPPIALYAASTPHHNLRGPAKNVLRKPDHCALYVPIAGTVFYANDERWRHARGVRHLFVLAGSASHVVALPLFAA